MTTPTTTTTTTKALLRSSRHLRHLRQRRLVEGSVGAWRRISGCVQRRPWRLSRRQRVSAQTATVMVVVLLLLPIILLGKLLRLEGIFIMVTCCRHSTHSMNTLP